MNNISDFIIKDRTIVSYKGSDPVVEIPSEATRIGARAFANNKTLEQVIFHDMVFAIESNAFYRCSALKRVYLSKNLNDIDSKAFFSCSSLEEIKLPSLITRIPEKAFYGCSSLKRVTMPGKLRFIEDGAFGGCAALESVTFPVSVSNVAKSAFENCPSLTAINGLSFNLLSNLDIQFRFLALEVFTKRYFIDPVSCESELEEYDRLACATICYNIKKILKTESIRRYILSRRLISRGGIDYLLSQEQFSCISPEIGAELQEYSDNLRVKTRDDLEWLYKSTQEGIALTRYIGFSPVVNVPSEINGKRVTEIKGAFSMTCVDIREVFIPEGVTTIGSQAFLYRTTLERVVLPSTLVKISSFAFQGCTHLADITLPDGLTTLERYAFAHCDSLKSVKIPDGVAEIPNAAFVHCSSLEHVTLGKNLKAIRSEAFSFCPALKEIDIPEGVTLIEYHAFRCARLSRLTLPSSIAEIKGSAFMEAEINTVITTTLDNITEPLPYEVFCPLLVTLAEKHAQGATCEADTRLFSTMVGESPQFAHVLFQSTPSVLSLALELSLVSRVSAEYLLRLTEESASPMRFALLEYLERTRENDAFSSLSLDGKEDTELSLEQALLDWDFTPVENGLSLTKYHGISRDVVIPSKIDGKSVTELDMTFSMMNSDVNTYEITSIKIPPTVTIIGDKTFSGCEKLASIDIPDSVVKIGSSAFFRCVALKTAYVPKDTEIASNAFPTQTTIIRR